MFHLLNNEEEEKTDKESWGGFQNKFLKTRTILPFGEHRIRPWLKG